MDGDTSDLLCAAVQRAGRIRTELQELRKHAFAAAAAASTAASPTAAAAGSPGRKPSFAAPSPADRQPLQVVPLLLLPQGLQQGGDTGLKALAAQLPGSFSLRSGEQLAFLGDGPGSPAALAPGGTGELRASPKTSRKPWSIPASRLPQCRQQPAAGQQEEQQAPGDWEARALQVGAGGDASAGGRSFDEVLAALRAEGLVQLPGDELAGRHSGHAGAASDGVGHVRSRAASTRGGSAGWGTARSAAGSAAGGSSAAPRLGRPRPQQRAQQQQQQEQAAPPPPFDPEAVELQLRAKLEQVNAAKRLNEARKRAGATSSARTRSGRNAASSGRGAPVVPRLPLASLSRAGSAASSRQHSGRQSGRESEWQQPAWRPWQVDSSGRGSQQEGLEGRAARAAAAAAPAPEQAAPHLSTRKESHVSLSELLSTPTGSGQQAASGAAGGASAGLRRSTFSVPDAVSGAASASTAAGGAADGELRHQSHRIPGAAAAAEAHQPPAPASAAKCGSGIPPCGQLQSPPATPLEAAAIPEAAAAGVADSSASSSPASTGSSAGARRQASPVRGFPSLGDEEAPAGQQQQQQEQQQQQRAGSASGAERPPLGERSTSSIGRKRAASEAGATEESASVKKRSPEVASGRVAGLAAGLLQDSAASGAPAGAAAAAAPPEQRQLAGLFGSPVAPPAGAALAGQQQPAKRQPQPQVRAHRAKHVHECVHAAPKCGAAAAPSTQLQPAAQQAEHSTAASARQVVMPVVMQHSPQQRKAHQPAQRQQEEEREEQQPQQREERHQEQQQQQQPAPQTSPQVSRPAPQQQQQQAKEPACKAVGSEEERELPAESRWVPSRGSSPQQQHQQQQQELPSQSVLIGKRQQQQQQQRAPPANVPPQAPDPVTARTPPTKAPPPLQAAVAAAAAATAAAAAVAAAHTITPRRRMSSLEPQEELLPLREHPLGKLLLASAPELAGTLAEELLLEMRKGCVCRKAWVRPNFKQGGSTRRIQLAPGSGGRAEVLYPHGLFRKPLRFALRRLVVGSGGASWRPGAYLVLDTARGMLRLEPGSAAEHARWVLALNAALLASGALPAGCASDAPPLPAAAALGELRWSCAVLLA